MTKMRPVCTDPNCFFDPGKDKHLVGVMRTLITKDRRTGVETVVRRMRVKLQKVALAGYSCPKCEMFYPSQNFIQSKADDRKRQKKQKIRVELLTQMYRS